MYRMCSKSFIKHMYIDPCLLYAQITKKRTHFINIFFKVLQMFKKSHGTKVIIRKHKWIFSEFECVICVNIKKLNKPEIVNVHFKTLYVYKLWYIGNHLHIYVCYVVKLLKSLHACILKIIVSSLGVSRCPRIYITKYVKHLYNFVCYTIKLWKNLFKWKLSGLHKMNMHISKKQRLASCKIVLETFFFFCLFFFFNMVF